jgi:hypothetical protein
VVYQDAVADKFLEKFGGTKGEKRGKSKKRAPLPPSGQGADGGQGAPDNARTPMESVNDRESHTVGGTTSSKGNGY